MKKIYLLVLSAVSFVILAFPAVALAFRIPNPIVCSDMPCLVERITNFIFILGMALVPIMVILAAYNFITASGNPQKITLARNMLLYIFIGITIMLVARGIISIVKNLLGG